MNIKKNIYTRQELKDLIDNLEDGTRLTVTFARMGENKTWHIWWHTICDDTIAIFSGPDGICKCCPWSELDFVINTIWPSVFFQGFIIATIEPNETLTMNEADSAQYWDIARATRMASVHIDKVYRYIAEKGEVGKRYLFTSHSEYADRDYFFAFDVIEVDGHRAYLCTQGEDISEIEEYGIILSSSIADDVGALLDPPLNTPSPRYCVQDDYVGVTLAFKSKIMDADVKDETLSPDAFLAHLKCYYALSAAEGQFAKNILDEAKRISSAEEQMAFLKRMFRDTIVASNNIIKKLKF